MVFFPNTPKTKQRLIRPPFSLGFQLDARQLLTPGLHDLLHRFGLPGASTGSSCLDRCCILFHVLNISIYLYIYYYKQTISEISDDDLHEVFLEFILSWELMSDWGDDPMWKVSRCPPIPEFSGWEIDQPLCFMRWDWNW